MKNPTQAIPEEMGDSELLDPIQEAEAIKLARMSWYDVSTVLKVMLGVEELTEQQTIDAKEALFQHKYKGVQVRETRKSRF